MLLFCLKLFGLMVILCVLKCLLFVFLVLGWIRCGGCLVSVIGVVGFLIVVILLIV